MLLLALIVGAAAGWVYWKATRPPAWWETVRAADPVVVEQKAQEVESRVTTELSQVRPAPAPAAPAPGAKGSSGSGSSAAPNGRFTVALEDDEATAWLEDRLTAWMANRNAEWRWPVRFSMPRVAFMGSGGSSAATGAPGRVKLGVSLKEQGDEKKGLVVWAEVAPTVDEQGRLWLKAERMGIGRVGMGASTALATGSGIMERINGGQQSKDVDKILRVLEGREAAVQRPVISLGDGRLVRLVGLRFSDGKLEAELEPESRR